MIYRVLADAVLVFHLAFVAFVVFGGLLVLRWPKLAWAHLPALAWGIAVTSIGSVCPLTPLEKYLLVHGGEDAYRGGFIAHYITSVIYPTGLAPPVRVVLVLLLVAFTVCVYWNIWRRKRRDAPLR